MIKEVLIIVSNSVVTSSIASDLMYGHIDGVKLKCLNQAHNNNFLIIIPDVFVNIEVEGVNLYLLTMYYSQMMKVPKN